MLKVDHDVFDRDGIGTGFENERPIHRKSALVPGEKVPASFRRRERADEGKNGEALAQFAGINSNKAREIAVTDDLLVD